MKSVVIVFGFLFITEIQQTWAGGGEKTDTQPNVNGLGDGEKVADGFKLIASLGEKGTAKAGQQIFQFSQSNSNEPKGQQTQQTYQPNLREKANRMREKAAMDRQSALNKTQLGYNKFVDRIQTIFREAEKKQREEMKVIEQEHMKADIIAAAVWRNTFQKFTDAQKNAENKYQETFSTINKKVAEVQQVRDAVFHSADEHFVKTYAEAEENKEKIENENKELLENGETEYENAVKLARRMRIQAEREFWSVAPNYNTIPIEQWLKIAAKYETDMETYRRALQEADKKWQNVLSQIGIGKQYEETLNKAIMELVNTHRKAVSDAATAIEQYEEELNELQSLRENITRAANIGKQKGERDFREALDKAKNEADEKYKIIFQDGKKKWASAVVYLKKVKAEFQHTQAEISQKFEEAMKEALMVESGTRQPTQQEDGEKAITGKVIES